MRPKEAREIIENHLRHKFSVGGFYLPLNDEIVIQRMGESGLEEWTWKGLLCIAYDLQPKPKEELPRDISPNQKGLFE